MGKRQQQGQRKKHCCEGESSSSSSNYRLPLDSEASPRLIFFLGERGKTQAFLRMSDGTCEMRRYSGLRGCLATPQGWLVGHTTKDEHRESMLCLLNPTTLEKIYVPYPPLSRKLLRSFILSHPPAHPDSRVMAICNGISSHIYSWKLHASDSEDNYDGHMWQRHIPVRKDRHRIYGAVSTKQGQIYAVNYWGELFKFEPKRHSPFIKVIDQPDLNWQLQFQVKLLVEWCEEIYLVLMYCIR